MFFWILFFLWSNRCWQFDLWFLYPAFSKSNLNIWKFTVHILLKPGLENFEHNFTNVWKWSRSVVSDSLRPHGLQPKRLLCPWDFPGKSTGVGCHCLRWVQLCGSLSILWHCLSLGLEWKLTFPVLWPLLSFPNLLAFWVQHFHSIIFQDLK